MQRYVKFDQYEHFTSPVLCSMQFTLLKMFMTYIKNK